MGCNGYSPMTLATIRSVFWCIESVRHSPLSTAQGLRGENSGPTPQCKLGVVSCRADDPLQGRIKALLRGEYRVAWAAPLGHAHAANGILAVWPWPSTGKRQPRHKVYPYLMRKVDIRRANQVWVLDTTYIPMKRGSSTSRPW
jgi:hypothetical protein